MQPTFTSLVASNNVNDLAAYTTAAVTPTANRLLVAFVLNSHGSAPTTPTLSGGGVSTWTEQAVVTLVGGTHKLTAFRALTGASPTTEALTIDFNANTQTGCGWAVTEIADCVLTGTNGADGIIQSKTNAPASTGTTCTVTLDNAFGHADNLILAGFGLNGGRLLTPGTNFTAVSAVILSSPSGTLGVQSGRDSDLIADLSWTTGCQRAGIALEIVGATAAAGPSATTFPQLNTRGLNRWY